MAHIKGLDGIRGIAISLVLIEHYYQHNQDTSGVVNHFFNGLQSAIQTGRAGVILFFILSGILITGILLRLSRLVELGLIQPEVAWKSFFIRRSLRIFPIYFISIAIFLMLLPEYQKLLPWLISYTVNIAEVLRDLNFVAADFGYMGHFWSLAIEEQFYLFLPIGILFFRGKIKQIFLCLLLISLLFSVSLPFLGFSYTVSSRMTIGGCSFALLLGSLIAYLMSTDIPISALKNWLLISGTPLFGYLTWLWIGNYGVGGISTFYIAFVDIGMALFFAGLILVILESKILGNIVDNIVLRWLGIISYGLYVYHMLLISFFPNIFKIFETLGILVSEFSSLGIFFLKISIAVLLATFSYFFVEKPILKFRDKYFSSNF